MDRIDPVNKDEEKNLDAATFVKDPNNVTELGLRDRGLKEASTWSRGNRKYHGAKEDSSGVKNSKSVFNPNSFNKLTAQHREFIARIPKL